MANTPSIRSKQKIHILLLLLSVLFILFFTFIVRETLEVRHSGSRGLMLKPFREYIAMFREPDHMHYFWQITLNILLFIPFGFFFTVLLKHRKVKLLGLTVLIIGCLFSVSIELFQYITDRGLTEIDDVFNNTFGAIIGYWLYKTIMNYYKKSSIYDVTSKSKTM